jgi:NAD(P)-dependent dehydrogenase (short-subunit alcohol dehydrogenase family)
MAETTLAPLGGKRVIVTGGTSGIGREIVRQAAQAGAEVAFCGLNDGGADEILAALRRDGGQPYFQAFDLSDLDTTRRFAREAIAHLGGLDGLVNNAGSNFFRGVLGSRREDLERCFAVDFYPAWALSQEAHPALKVAGSGIVVNIASIHAQRTNPGAFPYNAAKAALVALTQSLALEWGADNIRAVALAPGFILTPLAQGYLEAQPDLRASLRQEQENSPLKRVGRPEDVASLVVYLLSGANLFLSGETILVDGGVSARL